MTQPVQEPTGERALGGAYWATSQLARRPPPPTTAATGVNMWPMGYELIRYDSVFDGFDVNYPGETTSFGTSNGTPSDVDAGSWLNHTWVEDTHQNANLIVPMRLGPKGSIWTVSLLYSQFNDGGTFEIKWQTISEDAPGHSYCLDGMNMIAGSTDRNSTLTFYKNSGHYLVDCYSGGAGTTHHNLRTRASEFRIGGDDGAAVTADAVKCASADSVPSFTGGAGIWVLQIKTTTKNGASSGYRVRLESVLVHRLIADSGFNVAM